MAKSKNRKGVADKVRKAKRAKTLNVFKVKSNPFEVKINKQKHTILGRKTKHDRGLPGVSRSKANKKRKETLLPEYKDRHKSNNMVDERFGEGDTNLSVEEKMLQRFAMEKKRKHDKMSLFNLNDEEEELTHFGQSLADVKDFDIGGQSDEEDSGVIAGEYVSEAHFGGGIFTKVKSEDTSENTDKPKSRKEVIDEIIMKSKRAKFEKQNAKDEANELREKLDNTWQEVEKLLKSSARTKKDKEVARDSFQPDDYDVAVKQMQYDRKAAPAARGKTEAEKAAEEAARMRHLEEERLGRMEENNGEAHQSSKHRSADDLNYDFLPEKITTEPVAYKDGVMVGYDPTYGEGDNDVLLPTEASDDDEANDGEKEDDAGDDADSNSSATEDDFSDIFSEEGGETSEIELSDYDDDDEEVDAGEALEKIKHSQSKNGDDRERSNHSHSFPENYEAFLKVLEVKHKGNAENCISHLRQKFSADLAKGNKERLQKLFQYTWQYLYHIFSEESLCMEDCNKIVSHLYELCQGAQTECAQFILGEMTATYKRSLTRNGRIAIPDFGHMMQFKLIKILFSTSDFFHPVATPAMVFMCHIIHSSRPSNLREVASCLFLCTILYEYVCFSKRFVPECLNFLGAVVCMAVPKALQRAKGLPAAASLHINGRNCELLVLKGDPEMLKKADEKPNLFKLLMRDGEESSEEDNLRVQLLATALRLSLKFVRLYAQIPCFKEVHDPLKAACARCLAGHGGDKSKHPLAGLLYEVQAEIQRLIKKRPKLSPLVRVEDNKPKPLRLYDPKIEDVCEPFQKGSRKKTSATKRERERLQHKYKREMKGAVREIRKDGRFLAREQLNEQIEKDKERAEKVKRLYGLLSNQEGEVKKINRKKFKLGTT